METADQLLASQDVEVKNLRHTLIDAEQAQKQQKKVYDDVVSERVREISFISILISNYYICQLNNFIILIFYHDRNRMLSLSSF